jgi:hypothetical protein
MKLFKKKSKFLALPADSRLAAPMILAFGILLGIIFSWVMLTSWDKLQAQSPHVVRVSSVLQ